MMALAPVDICNIALVQLGQDQIMTLTDKVKAAQLCNTMYPVIRDEMIRAHPWRRLKVRTNLAFQAGVTPPFQYLFSYLLPADYILLLDVWAGGQILRQQWEMEGNTILANVEGPLQIRYIRDSNDPSEWDSLMVMTFAARLAYALAEPLTQDSEKIKLAAAKFNELERRAKKAAASEGTPVNIEQPDPWVAVRFGGSVFDASLRNISEP